VRKAWLVLSAAAIGASAACRSHEVAETLPPAAADGGANSPSDEAEPPRREVAEERRTPLLPPLPCRVIGLNGDVRVGDVGTGSPLHAQETIPGEAWLTLAQGAQIVAKDPRTTRETTFFGPGRVRACVDHREESWLAEGRFESTSGAGETPGAEEWVETPVGIVRYLASTLRVQLRPERATVTVAGGTAFVWAPPDTRMTLHRTVDAGGAGAPNDDAWRRVSDGVLELRLRSKGSAVGDAQAAVHHCADLARVSAELAVALRELMMGDGGASIVAPAIVRQVEARREARAACAVAAVRVGILPESGDAAQLAAQISDADATWTAIPSSPAAPKE